MKAQIRNYFFSQTARDSGILLIGTTVSAFLGFITTFLLAPKLGAADFGIFNTALAFSQLMAELFEFGIGAATLSLVAQTVVQKKTSILTTALVVRLLSASLVGILIAILAPQLSLMIFNSLDFLPFVLICAWGTVLYIVVSWFQTLFQALKKFPMAASVNFSVNISRFLFVILLMTLGGLTAYSTYLSSQIAFIGSLLMCLFFTTSLFSLRTVQWQDAKKLLTFGLPIGLGLALTAVYARIDQIVVFRLLGESEAGIFGLASRISTLFIFSTTALNAALVPRFIELKNSQFTAYFTKSLLASVGLVAACVISIMLSPWLIPFFFGNEFQESVLIYQILGLGMSLFIFAFLFQNAVVYHFKKNVFPFFLSLTSLGILVGSLLWSIPLYGIVGAAWSVVGMYAYQAVSSVLYFSLVSKQA